ncbi:hypothetical protein K6119_15425 [Paracrocinitomix mangrovi]|uniref:hypothetical protein n=1 Tax=Paracrocinitomix mangrovi TaxID=2862509 RepID=UPI001C8DA594|nr:hypothetical protein [Paracrocinitomix mangrovi]UKN01119.1 hypothetical protein K6119_15425 [Paracrocinitomix mangrovi]
MKNKQIILIPLLLVLFSFTNYFRKNDADIKHIPTGIILDSMQNEIVLATENGLPIYYYSEIFTPVCNTGECLPVKVNFYWDLTGNYWKFNQPEGEILTKLDHEPFTESDYKLLEEILNGPDPRFGNSQVKHNGEKHGNQDVQHTTLAPAKAEQLSKYKMVDGITGSTLPQNKDKFVPGALYTTYTLWGLANDKRNLMYKYSQENLMQTSNYGHLLTYREANAQDLVINHLTENDERERIVVLMSIFDTAKNEVCNTLLHKVHYQEYQHPVCIQSLENKFYKTDDKKLRQLICQRWAYNFISDESIIKLSSEIHNQADIYKNVLRVFENKTAWPEKVFDNFLSIYPQLHKEQQTKLKEMIKNKKDLLTKKQKKSFQKKM